MASAELFAPADAVSGGAADPTLTCGPPPRAVTVVTLRGKWDIASRSTLWRVLSQMIVLHDEDVVVDLSEVTFVHTAIVRVLVVGRWLLERSDRRFVLRSPPKPVTRAFRLSGLTDCIEVREGPSDR